MLKKERKANENVLPDGFTLCRSTKRRTLAMKIHEDGSTTVYAPLTADASRILRFIEKNWNWVVRSREKVARHREAFPPLTDDEIQALRASAKAYLPMRVQYFAALMGLAPKSVRITSAKTRFGSCSAQNGISFSYLLMRYPTAAIDYVVVHELAHIKEKNHGKQFYALIARYMPDYKERAALLKKQ